MILKRAITCLVSILILFTANAQHLQATLSHYSTDDGLASNAIAYLSQDDYGFLWIATWNGLSRFDGYQFYNYKTGNSSGIKNLHNRIFDMAIDQSQNIWLRMYDGRVFVLNRISDQIINPFEGYEGYENYKTSVPVLVSSSGDVFVSIDKVGLFCFRLDKHGLRTDKVANAGPKVNSMTEGYHGNIWLGTNEGILRFDHAKMALEQKAILPGIRVTCLHSSGYNIYAGCADGTIYTFAKDKTPELIRQPSGYGIVNMFVDSSGLIWIIDKRMGATRLNPSTGNEKMFQQTVLVPEHDGTGGGFSESNGTVWVRMNHGGYGYYNREADNVEYFHNDPSNRWNLSNTVQASMELPEGVVWLSTVRRGLEKLEIQRNSIERKRVVANAVSTVENEIRAMYYDKQRQLLLIGNKHNTLFIYHKDGSCTTISTDENGKPLGRIYGISKDSKGNYWICSKGNGIYKMNPKGGNSWTLHNYSHQEGDIWSLSSNNAYQAVEDRQGNIWIATYGGGVNLLTRDKNGKEVFLHAANEMKQYPQESFLKARTLAIDKKGDIWAGTTDGLLVLSYKAGNLSIEKVKNAENKERCLKSMDIVCLNRDAEGNMWIGTNGGGIAHTIGQDKEGNWEFETFDAHNGLPSEEIRSITFDQRGNVWFGTDHIICSYDVAKGFLNTFSSLEGVDETMLSESAAITLENGDILFGSLNGYYIVDREKLVATAGSQLKLRITDFFINDELQSPRLNDTYKEYPPECKTIRIPGQRVKFSFRFASLSYQLQHRVHYQYMLEGYDNTWQNADKYRMASYSDVPAGTYLLKIKAFLLESPEKYDMRTIEVIVPGGFIFANNTTWIYVGLLLLAIVLLLLSNKSVRRKLGLGSKKSSLKKRVVEEEADGYEVIS